MTAFRCVGGTLLFHTAPLTDDDAVALIGTYRDEWAAAVRARDWDASQRAAVLHGEIYRARLQAKQWARASGGYV